MKKLYFLLLILMAVVSSSQAQQIIPIPNDSAEITTTVNDEFQPNDIHIGLKNNTSGTITVTWGMIHYTAPSTWEVKLCDNDNCYDLLLNGGPYISLPVVAGDTLDMKFQYTAHTTTGSGSTYVYAYVTGDSSNSVVFLNYKANLTFVNGIADKYSSNHIKLYPNPVQHSFIVSDLENAGNLSFEVYDMKGTLVKSHIKSATNSQIEISVDNLPVGEYVLKAYDSTGNIIGNARLTKVD